MKTNNSFEKWIAGLDNDTGKDIYLENKHLAKRVCWDRPWLNMTYMDILETVYDKYLVKSIILSETSEFPDVKSSIVFLPSFGFCKEITKYDPLYELYVIIPSNHQGKTRIFITDRNYRSYISPYYSTHKGNAILVDYGDTVRYDVKFQVFSTCTIVNHEQYDYSSCVDDGIKNTIGRTFGCVPPWMSPNNTCNGIYPGNFRNKIADFNKKYVRTALTLQNNDIEKSCQKNCKVTDSTVSFRHRETIEKSVSTTVAFNFEQQVKQFETIYSYNLYHFIIDVGSSLGLWFGLSVLSLNHLAIVKNRKIFKTGIV